MVTGFVLPLEAAQAEGGCFCSTVTKDELSGLSSATDPKTLDDPNKYDAVCLPLLPPECVAGSTKIDKKYTACGPYETPAACQDAATDWKKTKDDTAQRLLTSSRAQRTELHNKGVIEKLLPSCVFETEVTGDCQHINVFIKVGIDIADYILSIVGALALVVFIYGGVMMIISEGNADRVEKGKGAMVAALIGLIVVFGAYILVKFFAGVVGVQPGFNLQ